MFTDGILFKNNENLFTGVVRNLKGNKEAKIICKKYKDNRYNVFIDCDGKISRVGTLILINPIQVRGDKLYKQIGIIKLFNDDYEYNVLEDKTKNGKVYYKIL